MWPPRSSSTAGSISVWVWLCREMANRERNKKILLELVKQSDNSRCADCGEPGKQIYKRWYVCYRNKVRRGSEFDVRVLLRGLEMFRFDLFSCSLTGLLMLFMRLEKTVALRERVHPEACPSRLKLGDGLTLRGWKGFPVFELENLILKNSKVTFPGIDEA